ncbi:MAG: alpha-amylase family glycosyl hydrolase [Candidatus Woykebacteria bacterium]
MVVYQIYPKSFKDSNNDGVGDLAGLIQKLDYLSNNAENCLNVGAIWLSPIFKSPMLDGGYDVADYLEIDPVFGNLSKFNKLIGEAHKRNIKVLLDFVPNHTSEQHKWFLESKSSKYNPKRDYYIWADPKEDGSPPNNWLSVFGGSAWEYDKRTGQYYLHSFYKEQPDLNWRNPAILKEMTKILKFWMDIGVDGFRVDAVHMLVKDALFRDDLPNYNYQDGVDDPYKKLNHVYSMNQPERFKILIRFCKLLESYEDKFMVTEDYTDIPGMIDYYKNYNSSRCAPLNLNLLLLPWNAKSFKKFIDTYERSLKPHHIPNYVLSNHDRARVSSRLDQSAARVAAMLLLTLRGIPFIYYGDELGLKNVRIPKEKITDRNSAGQEGLEGGRDPVRTPMQWDSSKYAGFSRVEPWLPVAGNYRKVNVRNQSKNRHSMLSLYKKLISLRNKNEALRRGSYVPLPMPGKDVFAYIRRDGKEKVLVLLNFSNKNCSISIEYPNPKIICDTSLGDEIGKVVDLSRFKLKPNEGYIISI